MPNPNNQTGQEAFLSTQVDAAVYEETLRRNNFAGRTIGDVLTAIAVIPDSNLKKGLKFEKLTQWALPLARSAEIKSVRKPRGKDIGMDLVATGEDGAKVAIQCKFYTTQNIRRNELLKFRDAAEEKNIETKWLVCGGRGIGDEAKKFTERNNIRIVDLRQYRDTVLTTRPLQIRAPLPLQKEAIDAVVQGFTSARPGEHGDRRGKLIMACGTGKTFTSLRIAEQLAPGFGPNILFIAPSIALVAQARKEYLDHSARKLRTLIICSDQTAGHDEDIQPNEITGRVTTSPEEIAAALTELIADGAAQATFCTYQSLDKLLEAQIKHGAPKFNLAIIDEAHRTTGLLKEGDEGQFLLIHDATKIQADMRLYMTATQRIYKDSAARRRAEKDPGTAVVDMNDTARYGNLFYHLTFKQAVDAGILCDYRVIALGVTESIIGLQLTNTLLALNDEVADSTARKSRKGRAADAQSVLALGAISLAINGFIKGDNHPDSIPRTIAYANNIVRSKWLERALQEPQMKGWVTRTGRRDSQSAKALTIDAQHLDGTSSAVKRHTALNWLGDGTAQSPRLITNAQLFTEGVDVPALNAIAFLDPRKSKIDTVQAVGRVMRKDRDNPDKVHGYIIVPVIVPPGSNLLDTLKTDKARFQSLGNVMRALRSHDERFDTDLHLLLGEVIPPENGGENGRGTEPPPEDIEIQQSLLDDETKRAIFAQLTKDTGIGSAGKNTADDITIAINRAAAILQAAGAGALIAETIGTPTDNAEESCKTAALLIANACIMHKRLDETGNLGGLEKIECAHNAGNPPDALYRAWVTILQKDYSPIFQDAAALVKRMSPFDGMHAAIRVLTECAMSNATTLNELGFDHAGPLYHRVLGTAQSDGAFYTKNLSA
ncbi:MAG: DEAD/DEAH box helicase family protein, partial [Gammaproteobacteria bacterium]|nr:DEAD/DEAH box helicase family protein [Gammaproteobacteria bacterium]